MASSDPKITKSRWTDSGLEFKCPGCKGTLYLAWQVFQQPLNQRIARLEAALREIRDLQIPEEKIADLLWIVAVVDTLQGRARKALEADDGEG